MPHATPAMEAPQNISLYSKEPKRIGYYNVMTSSAPPLPPPHRTQPSIKPSSSMSKVQQSSPKQK